MRSFAQLEKVLTMVAFDAEFAERLIRYGESAKTRYAFLDREGQVLDRLLVNEGAGIRALQNVFQAVMETHEGVQRQKHAPMFSQQPRGCT
jgi:hypothetical protein